MVIASAGGDGKVHLSLLSGGTRIVRLKTVQVGGECVALSNFYGVGKAGGRGFDNWLEKERAEREMGSGVGGILSVYQVSEQGESSTRFVPWVGGRGGSMLPPPPLPSADHVDGAVGDGEVDAGRNGEAAAAAAAAAVDGGGVDKVDGSRRENLLRWYADSEGKHGLWGKFRLLVGTSDNQVDE
jgi:hypothetical protein